MSTKVQPLTVSVLLHMDRGAWVAQCLEYDVAAQGATIPEAKENFLSTLEAQIRFDLRDGKTPLADLDPAPRSYRDHLGRAVTDGPELPVCVPCVPKERNVRIVHARFLQKHVA